MTTDDTDYLEFVLNNYLKLLKKSGCSDEEYKEEEYKIKITKKFFNFK